MNWVRKIYLLSVFFLFYLTKKMTYMEVTISIHWICEDMSLSGHLLQLAELPKLLLKTKLYGSDRAVSLFGEDDFDFVGMF